MTDKIKKSKKQCDALIWAENLAEKTKSNDFVEWFFDAGQIEKDFRVRLNGDNLIAEAIIRRLFKKYQPLNLKADSKQKKVRFTRLEDIQNYLSKKYPIKTADEFKDVPLIYHKQFTEKQLSRFCNQLIQANQEAVKSTKYPFLTSMFNQLAKSEKNVFLNLLKGSLMVRKRLAEGISEMVIDHVFRDFYLSLGSAWMELNDAEKDEIREAMNKFFQQANYYQEKYESAKGLRGGGKPYVGDAEHEKLADIIIEKLKSKSKNGIVDADIFEKMCNYDVKLYGKDASERKQFRLDCMSQWNKDLPEEIRINCYDKQLVHFKEAVAILRSRLSF